MSKAQRLLRLPNRIPVKTLADVRATIGKEDYYDLIFTLGKDTVNDGYAAEYYWSSQSLANDDNEDVTHDYSVCDSDTDDNKFSEIESESDDEAKDINHNFENNENGTRDYSECDSVDDNNEEEDNESQSEGLQI